MMNKQNNKELAAELNLLVMEKGWVALADFLIQRDEEMKQQERSSIISSLENISKKHPKANYIFLGTIRAVINDLKAAQV